MTRAREGSDRQESFSLVAGGPFSALLGRLGLLGPDRLPTAATAVGIAVLAWALPAALAVAQTLLDERYVGWRYFDDWTAYARFFVAVLVMLATERYADRRLSNLVQHFRESHLLDDRDLPAFNAAVEAADRRSESTAAELVILAVALVWSGVTTARVVDLAGLSWEGTLADGVVVLSWAGEAARFASNPLFVFLVLRWLWRFGVWTLLLFRLSRLPLQLTPLHPDRAGGLGFLSIYPGIFNGFVFALSCVTASSIVKELRLEHHSSDIVWLALAVWLGICLILVTGPLLVFAWPLYQLRERALLDYGRLATQHHIAFHRKWVGETRSGEQLMGSPDPSSASDINATVGAVLDMRFAPVDRLAVVQLLVAAGLPLLAVVPTQVPIAQVAKWLLGHVV